MKKIDPRFLQTEEQFGRKIRNFLGKYGYNQYFLVVGEPFDQSTSEYKAYWEQIHEGMVDCVETAFDIFKERQQN